MSLHKSPFSFHAHKHLLLHSSYITLSPFISYRFPPYSSFHGYLPSRSYQNSLTFFFQLQLAISPLSSLFSLFIHCIFCLYLHLLFFFLHPSFCSHFYICSFTPKLPKLAIFILTFFLLDFLHPLPFFFQTIEFYQILCSYSLSLYFLLLLVLNSSFSLSICILVNTLINFCIFFLLFTSILNLFTLFFFLLLSLLLSFVSFPFSLSSFNIHIYFHFLF